MFKSVAEEGDLEAEALLLGPIKIAGDISEKDDLNNFLGRYSLFEGGP